MSVHNYVPPVKTLTATIASGSTASGEIDLGGCSILGIQLPAAFTGTALTFQAASSSGGTYQTVYDEFNSALSLTVTQGRTYAIGNGLMQRLAAFRYIKIVSGSSEGADRSLTVFARPI